MKYKVLAGLVAAGVLGISGAALAEDVTDNLPKYEVAKLNTKLLPKKNSEPYKPTWSMTSEDMRSSTPKKK